MSQRLWGLHRSRGSGEAMAQKYGRDALLPALCGQLKVAQAIGKGWCPLTLQTRGAHPCAQHVCVCVMFIVNRLSARLHAAVLIEDGAVRRACSTCKDIGNLRWEA